MAGPEDGCRVIRKILQKIVTEYAPQKVVLFGSYAWGNPGPDSDIDLLMIKETPERFLERWTTVQRILSGTPRSLPVEGPGAHPPGDRETAGNRRFVHRRNSGKGRGPLWCLRNLSILPTGYGSPKRTGGESSGFWMLATPVKEGSHAGS